MPKIPLYQQQSSIGTARGVQIDPTPTIKASTIGIESEAAFMQDVLNLGSEVIDQFAKSKTAGDKANYETSVINLQKELNVGRAERSDLNDIEYNDQVVQPRLDKFYSEWAESRGMVDDKTFNTLWREDKNTIDTKYTGLATGYKAKQFEVDQINLANEKFNNNEIEAGDSIIDNIGTLSPEDKDTAKKSGHYSRILTNMLEATDPDELRRAYNDDYLKKLNPSQRFELKRRAFNRGKEIIRDQYKPTYDEGITLAKGNELSQPWIESQRESKTLPEGILLMFEGLLETDATQSINDLSESDRKVATQLIESINTFAETGEIPTILGISKGTDRIDYLGKLYERANNLGLNADTINWMFSPLTDSFKDINRNQFWLDGDPNFPTSNTTYKQERNIVMGAFRQNFNSITANLPASMYNEYYIEGIKSINEKIIEAEKNNVDLTEDDYTAILGNTLQQIYNVARQYESVRRFQQGTSGLFGRFELNVEEEFFPEK
jgi:hypothetical protein